MLGEQKPPKGAAATGPGWKKTLSKTYNKMGAGGGAACQAFCLDHLKLYWLFHKLGYVKPGFTS